jgi:hypothetical protein
MDKMFLQIAYNIIEGMPQSLRDETLRLEAKQVAINSYNSLKDGVELIITRKKLSSEWKEFASYLRGQFKYCCVFSKRLGVSIGHYRLRVYQL